MGDIREPLRELTECGLPQALEVMGERWSFMILRASFNGLHHFEEFLSELGIARNILSNRLAKLVEHGILERKPMAEDRRKIEYRLTEKGFDLLPDMKVSNRIRFSALRFRWRLRHFLMSIRLSRSLLQHRRTLTLLGN